MLRAEIMKDLLDLKENEGLFFIEVFFNTSEKIENNSAYRLELNTPLEEVWKDEISNILSVSKDFCKFFKNEILIDMDIIKPSSIKIIELALIPCDNKFSIIDTSEYIENHVKFSKSIEAEEIMNNFNKIIFDLTNNLNKAIDEYISYNN